MLLPGWRRSAPRATEPRLEFVASPAGWSLTWPAASPAWVLQRSRRLGPAARWEGVAPEAFHTEAERVAYLLPVGASSQFYRLSDTWPATTPNLPQIPGLRARWGMDEGSGLEAAEAHDLPAPLLLSNMTWASGRIGPGALRGNGLSGTGGSRAALGESASELLPATGQPFSVSLWFSPGTLTSQTRALLGTATNSQQGWQLVLNAPAPGQDEITLHAASPAGAWSLTGRALLLPERWYQLTLAHDGAGTCLYLDAAQLACAAGAVNPGTGPLWLGGGFGDYASFLGRLDDLRIYTNCLTTAQIALAGEWTFDDAPGTTAADSSLGGHPAGGLLPEARVPGRQGGGLDLRTGPVSIANDDADVLPTDGGAFSLSCWLQPAALPVGRRALLQNRLGDLGWDLAVETTSGGETWLRWTAAAPGTLDLAALLPLLPGAWSKLDLTFNGGVATVYLNGRAVHTDYGALRGAAGAILLGAASGEETFPCIMDELRCYRRERRAEEIGPVAPALWETVLVNTTTNWALPGAGPTGRALTYALLPAPAPTRGTVTLAPATGVVTYQAGAVKGPDTFAYTVSDGEFTSAPTLVVVSVVQPHWLAPAGGPEPERDGTSPSRAWVAGTTNALDAIWRTNNFYDAFFYAPGVYETQGWQYLVRPTAFPGCKHYGAGTEGTSATTLRLVNTWQAYGEGVIFAGPSGSHTTDAFEVHDLVLDCNAAGNPKYTIGEPVWLRIPLTSTARVDTVTLRWADRNHIGTTLWRVGRAAEFTLCARALTNGVWVNHCQSFTNTGWVDVVPFDVTTDELTLICTRRAGGVDFYGVREMEIAGATPSVPTATASDGNPSRLDASRTFVAAVDGSPATVWASGFDDVVQLTFPLAAGTGVSQINLNWNCQTVADVGWLGPAAEFIVLARDAVTGAWTPLPHARHGRAASGLETVTLGPPGQTNTVFTSEIALLLTARGQASPPTACGKSPSSAARTPSRCACPRP